MHEYATHAHIQYTHLNTHTTAATQILAALLLCTEQYIAIGYAMRDVVRCCDVAAVAVAAHVACDLWCTWASGSALTDTHSHTTHSLWRQG